MTTQGEFTYSRGTDGCDETFDIYHPNGEHLTSIHFWERAEGAEADAKLIVHRLNMHGRLLDALNYLLEQTVDQDLKYGIGLSEGEQDARAKALAVIAETDEGDVPPQEDTVAIEERDATTPWAIGLQTDEEQAQIISATGWHVATVQIDPVLGTAKRIVRCVNAHERLLEAAKRTVRQFELILEMDDPQSLTQIEWEAEPLASLRQAIAEAE